MTTRYSEDLCESFWTWFEPQYCWTELTEEQYELMMAGAIAKFAKLNNLDAAQLHDDIEYYESI